MVIKERRERYAIGKGKAMAFVGRGMEAATSAGNTRRFSPRARVSQRGKTFTAYSMSSSSSLRRAPCTIGAVTARPSRRKIVIASASLCSMQFIKGVEEPTVPEVKLTRSKDGAQGTAIFYFEKPAVFENSGEMGEITGLYMIDDEGEMSTVDVVAKFKNGQPAGIEAKYIMKSSSQWDRFMRFMQRYAEDNNLGFNKSK